MTASAVAAVLLAAPATADTPGSDSGTAPDNPEGPMGAEPIADPSPGPSISPSSDLHPGQTLTLDQGEWNEPPKDGQRWLRCGAMGMTCEYTFVTGITYPVTSTDLHKTIKVRERRDVPNALPLTGASSNEVDTAPTATVTPPPATGTGKPASPTPKPAAARAPRNTSLPRISGRLREGSLLTSTRGSWSGTSPITYRYRWYRCEVTCKSIRFATRPDYRLQHADVRRRVELVVTAINRAGFARAATARTDAIAPKRIGRIRARVTISGRVTRTGVKLSRFRVRAERGATISIRCKGRGCPFKRLSRLSPRGSLPVRRLQRQLRGGIVIAVSVRRSFTIGKYTRFRIRAARFPLRGDRCLKEGRTRPVRCPR